MVRLIASACIGLGVGLAGCSSDVPVADIGDDGEAGESGNPAGGASGVTCESGPGFAEPAEPRQIDSVTATLVDIDDNPVPNELVQVCGTDVCFSGESTEAGGVAISPGGPLTKPAFKFGDGRKSARFAWLLPSDGTEIDLGSVRTVLLPALDSGEPLVAGEMATSAGLSLLPAANGRISIDRLTFQSADEQALRAVRIPLERAPAVVEASLGFEIVYAATPTETEFCPPAMLRIENSAEWEPGTAVEVWLHGIDISEKWAPFGGWAKLTDAEVSADGSRIETTSAGLPVLGVLGFKRR